MADKISKLQRWLDLVAYLAGRRVPATAEEVWAAVPAYVRGLEGDAKEHETVRRMFERDKDDLRAAGIPIETVTFSINYGTEESHGYRLLRRDFHLPYLRLVREAEREDVGATGGPSTARPSGSASIRAAESADSFAVAEDEAGAALDGLREVASLPAFPLRSEARSAFRKLAFDLEPDTLEPSPVVYVEDAETAAAADTLRRLSPALLARKTVTFRYHSMGRDEEALRTVRPYGLLFQHGRWYLVAHAEDRDEVRMFRVGRMADVRPNPKSPGTPDFEVPADFELHAYAGRKAWELGEGPEPPVQARVWFRFPRSLWAERNGHGTLVREARDGSQVREIAVHRPEPFIRWVLSLEGDARVEEPPELHAYAGRKAWELGEGPEPPVQARVWFRFPRSLWAERNGHGTLVRESRDGSQVREIAVHRPEPFIRWVLSLEGDARVEEPPELREAFLRTLAQVARLYAAGTGSPPEPREGTGG